MDFMLLLFLYLPSIIMVSSILIFPIMFIKILSSYRKKNDFNTKKNNCKNYNFNILSIF